MVLWHDINKVVDHPIATCEISYGSDFKVFETSTGSLGDIEVSHCKHKGGPWPKRRMSLDKAKNGLIDQIKKNADGNDIDLIMAYVSHDGIYASGYARFRAHKSENSNG